MVRCSAAGLPPAFYTDFARIADDESRHLGWCLQRLGELGYAYGCMPAHNLRWDGARVSSGDLGGRLAVVPLAQVRVGGRGGGRGGGRMMRGGRAECVACCWGRPLRPAPPAHLSVL